MGSILASTPPVDDAASNNTDPAVTAQSFDEPETDTVGDVAQDTNSSMPILQGDYLNSTDANPTLVNEDPKPMDGNQRIASPCQSPLEWNSVRCFGCMVDILPTLISFPSFDVDLVNVHGNVHPSRHAGCFNFEFRFVDERSFGNPLEHPQHRVTQPITIVG